MTKKLTERFEMRLSEEGVERLDAWRRLQADIPSRAEAIRRLVEMGLAASKADEALGEIWAAVGTLSDRTDLPEDIKSQLEAIWSAIGAIEKATKTSET